MNKLLIKDYISNDLVANKLITDFTTNKYVIKGSTGIGGTSAVFNITSQSIIIVSPTVGMIKSKEEKRQPHHRFIYEGSTNSWSQDIIKDFREGRKVIINTTPENLMLILNGKGALQKELQQHISKLPFFVDEYDMYTNASYRLSKEDEEPKGLEQFIYYLFNQHKGNYTLSTATPAKHHLNVPCHARLDYWTISKEDEIQKKLEVMHLNHLYNWVKNEIGLNRKVLIFTSDIRQINKFRNTAETIAVQPLVGPDLAVKISESKGQSLGEFMNIEKGIPVYDNEVFILSSRYLIGFDFEEDCSIAIVADEMSQVDCLVGGEIAQAYGRARKNVHNAALFFRKGNYCHNLDSHESKLLENFPKEHKDIDFLKKATETITDIHRSNTYYNLANYMQRFGFELTFNTLPAEIEPNSRSFGDRYYEIANQNSQVTSEQFNFICDRIKGDDTSFNGYSTTRLLTWAAAVIGEYCPYLASITPQRYSQLLNLAKAVVDLNELTHPKDSYAKIATTRVSKDSIDWTRAQGGLISPESYRIAISASNGDSFNKARKVIHTLYKIEQVQNDEYNQKTFNFVTALADVYDKVKSNLLVYLNKQDNQFNQYLEAKDFFNLKRIANFAIVDKKLRSIIIKNIDKVSSLSNLDADEMVQINKKLDDTIGMFAKYERSDDLGKKLSRDLFFLNYSVEIQKERHKYYLLSLLSMDVAGHTNGFKVKGKDNRFYNPATKCTRQFRKEVPFELAIFDIVSAYPRILNLIINSKNNNQYEFLQSNLGVTRAEAKVIFNSALNSTHFSKSKYQIDKLTKTFMDCGYTEEEAKRVFKEANGDGLRGSFFRRMTEIEEKLIKSFTSTNKVDKFIRLHDSVVFYNTIDVTNFEMQFDNIEFGYEIIGSAMADQ